MPRLSLNSVTCIWMKLVWVFNFSYSWLRVLHAKQKEKRFLPWNWRFSQFSKPLGQKIRVPLAHHYVNNTAALSQNLMYEPSFFCSLLLVSNDHRFETYLFHIAAMIAADLTVTNNLVTNRSITLLGSSQHTDYHILLLHRNVRKHLVWILAVFIIFSPLHNFNLLSNAILISDESPLIFSRCHQAAFILLSWAIQFVSWNKLPYIACLTRTFYCYVVWLVHLVTLPRLPTFLFEDFSLCSHCFSLASYGSQCSL